MITFGKIKTIENKEGCRWTWCPVLEKRKEIGRLYKSLFFGRWMWSARMSNKEMNMSAMTLDELKKQLKEKMK